MKTAGLLLICACLATLPDSRRQSNVRMEPLTGVPGTTCRLTGGAASVAPSATRGIPGAELLSSSFMAGAVGAGDSTDGFVSAGPSYLDIALEMCIRGCTANPYVSGMTITFSLVYTPVRVFFGGFLSGCIAGCYGAYASRW